ncbi:MAG: protein kinase, partial [Gemmatimonadales bacterium]
TRGPLARAEGLAIADDVLAALEAVHARGIVHRDVKPANVFLVSGRAVLGDFGISKSPASGDPTLTATGHVVGTPAYMPPEQLAGSDVTARTDVCAAGLVIYEIFTGRTWTFDSKSDQADFSGIPPRMLPALRHALAWNPRERWANAREFRRALQGRAKSRMPRALVGTAVVALLAVAGWRLWGTRRASSADAVRVEVRSLRAEGGVPQNVADSVTARLVHALRGAADIDFQLAPAPQADVTVEGRLETSADTARVTMRATRAGRGEPLFERTVTGTLTSVVDSAARMLLLEIWNNRDRTFRDLPVQALPQSPIGLAMWSQAEVLYARGQWAAAFSAYENAARTDSTCSICYLRLMIIPSWLRQSPDRAFLARLRRAIGVFTPPYQAVIRAGSDSVDRWGALEKLVATAPRFDLGHFVYGDELFHRGPLAGRSRSLAMHEFRAVVQLRPHFAPAWEHLTWVAIAQGDSVTAAQALARYEAESAPDDIETRVKRALFNVGFLWRFAASERAVQTTEYVLAQPLIAEFPDLRLGGTYMTVFDAPQGDVWLGRRFEAWRGRSADLRAPGLVAQIVGYLAGGRTDSARSVMRRLAGASEEPEFPLVAAEFEAALALFDSLDARAAWMRLEPALSVIARSDAASPLQRRRAAWMLTLLARRAHRDERPWRAPLAHESEPAPFATLLDADSIAATAPRSALAKTRRLLELDSAGRAGDPFFRSALHLLRAEWMLKDGHAADAARELLWYGNYDVVDQPAGPAQAADVDWSLGTIARWRRARLGWGDAGSGFCSDLADVARLWANADPRDQVRADSARTQFSTQRCTDAR